MWWKRGCGDGDGDGDGRGRGGTERTRRRTAAFRCCYCCVAQQGKGGFVFWQRGGALLCCAMLVGAEGHATSTTARGDLRQLTGELARQSSGEFAARPRGGGGVVMGATAGVIGARFPLALGVLKKLLELLVFTPRCPLLLWVLSPELHKPPE